MMKQSVNSMNNEQLNVLNVDNISSDLPRDKFAEVLCTFMPQSGRQTQAYNSKIPSPKNKRKEQKVDKDKEFFKMTLLSTLMNHK